ncbi:hypothetical protein NBH20_01510 [Rhizobium sp. S153]|uniref:Uncharacterized protein n=1 Tax=Ciceribacter sichuanensis TaxID=2949647 RepID=A0ABT0V1P8_9HYPH|nr:hypothetical protein [Ciceribacter sp. S153]MCM2399819.1 hypothetical protein [Ciceribacter sp. S153]
MRKIVEAVERVINPFDRWLTTSPIPRIAAVVVGTLTVFQLWIDLDAKREERTERVETQIERAWERLYRRQSGDTGKGYALNLLLKSDTPPNDIFLGCKTIGEPLPNGEYCEHNPIISGVDFPPNFNRLTLEAVQGFRDYGTHTNINPLIYQINFQGISIKYSKFNNHNIGNNFMMGSYIEFSQITNSNINSDASINNSDVRNSVIGAMEFGYIADSNLSGSSISIPYNWDPRFTEETLNRQFHNGNWAWADDPPRFLINPGAGFMSWADPARIGVNLCDPTVGAAGGQDPAYEHTNREYVPLYDFIRDFEIGPVVDMEVQPPEVEYFNYFGSPFVPTGSNVHGCALISAEDARNKWPDRYETTSDLRKIAKHLEAVLDIDTFKRAYDPRKSPLTP